MTTAITTPTAAEFARRIGRFSDLQAMSTSSDLAWVPQGAHDVLFARKILPVVLEDTKNLFGNRSPITGAGGMTMFISVMPPGQGPCLHSHNNTYETFMVLEGTIEYHVGEPIEHTATLGKWDVLSVPPRVYRSFRNVGTTDAVQLTVISGPANERDDVTCPHSVAAGLARDYGQNVVEAFKGVLQFDPPRT